MSDYLSQRAALREMAQQRAADKVKVHARIVELHAQRLPTEIIAKRLRIGGTTVKKVLAAAGLTGWHPWQVDV